MLLQLQYHGFSCFMYLVVFIALFLFAPDNLASLTSIVGLIGIAAMDQDIKNVQDHLVKVSLESLARAQTDSMSSSTSRDNDSVIYSKLKTIIRAFTAGDVPGFFVSGTSAFIRVTFYVVIRVSVYTWVTDGLDEALVQTWKTDAITRSVDCFAFDEGLDYAGRECTLITKDMVKDGLVKSGLALTSAKLHTRVVQAAGAGVTDAVYTQYLVSLILALFLCVDLAFRLSVTLERLSAAQAMQRFAGNNELKIPIVPGAVRAVVAALKKDGIEVTMPTPWGDMVKDFFPHPFALALAGCVSSCLGEKRKAKIRFDMKTSGFRKERSSSGCAAKWIAPLIFETDKNGDEKYVPFNSLEVQAAATPVAVCLGFYAAYRGSTAGRLDGGFTAMVVVSVVLVSTFVALSAFLIKQSESATERAQAMTFEATGCYTVCARKFSRTMALTVSVISIMAVEIMMFYWLISVFNDVIQLETGIPLMLNETHHSKLVNYRITNLDSTAWQYFSIISSLLVAGAFGVFTLSRICRILGRKKRHGEPPKDEPCPDLVIWEAIICEMARTGIILDGLLSLAALEIPSAETSLGKIISQKSDTTTTINWAAVHMFWRSHAQRARVLQKIADGSAGAESIQPLFEHITGNASPKASNAASKEEFQGLKQKQLIASNIELIVLKAILMDPSGHNSYKDCLRQVLPHEMNVQVSQDASNLKPGETSNPLNKEECLGGQPPHHLLEIEAEVSTKVAWM